MTDVILDTVPSDAISIRALGPRDLGPVLSALSPLAKGYAEAAEFQARPGQVVALPGQDGRTTEVLFGLGDTPDAMAFRALPSKLRPASYRLETVPAGLDLAQVALAFALGSYRFDRYRARGGDRPRLAVPGVAEAVRLQAHACALARDMINTPANDMGPRQIEAVAREIAEQYGARVTVVEGEGLLLAGYPAVHAVGRAAVPERAPRMLELSWGLADDPLVALVGKGVVFDTGGLDIKPSSGMRLMKKDMGGAAHVLALARMVMAAGLRVRLAVLIPVVENAIGGDAMRPGDVLSSRKDLTIEVGNTDAEGRLILADALARAGELAPVLTIDLATLTGAARAALGPQLPPFFTDDEVLAADIARHAAQVCDPVYRLPLWAAYDEALESEVADVKNDPDAWAQAGAITAALFLKRFAPQAGSWVHFDIFAWNNRTRPGHPTGGEAQAIRGLFSLLSERFG